MAISSPEVSVSVNVISIQGMGYHVEMSRNDDEMAVEVANSVLRLLQLVVYYWLEQAPVKYMQMFSGKLY